LSARDGAVVREGRAADSPALAGLLSQLGHEVDRVWLEGWLRHVERASDRVLVAEVSGEPVGVAVLHLAPFLHEGRNRLRLTALVVDRSARSRGIGALLLDACEEIAREMGCQSLELTTREERRDAHRFYERQGYADTGRRYLKQLG
jgi:ribosomal protein S18 acetylase RimI-like enzyme